MKMSKDKKSITDFFKNRLQHVKKKPSQLSLPLALTAPKSGKIMKPADEIPPLRRKGSRRLYHVVQFVKPPTLTEASEVLSSPSDKQDWSYQIFNTKPWSAGEILEFLSDNRYPNPHRTDMCKFCNRLRPIEYLPRGFDNKRAERKPLLLYLVDHSCLKGFEEGLEKNNPCHITVYRPLNSSKNHPVGKLKLIEIHQELKNTYVFLSRKHFFQFFSITPEEFQQLHENPVAICLNGMYLYQFKRYNQTYYFSVIQPDLTAYTNHQHRRFRENISI